VKDDVGDGDGSDDERNGEAAGASDVDEYYSGLRSSGEGESDENQHTEEEREDDLYSLMKQETLAPRAKLRRAIERAQDEHEAEGKE